MTSIIIELWYENINQSEGIFDTLKFKELFDYTDSCQRCCTASENKSTSLSHADYFGVASLISIYY